jgi:hypothetical protein
VIILGLAWKTVEPLHFLLCSPDCYRLLQGFYSWAEGEESINPD